MNLTLLLPADNPKRGRRDGRERQLRIRAHSAPGRVAGAANYLDGRTAQGIENGLPGLRSPNHKPQARHPAEATPPPGPNHAAGSSRSFMPVLAVWLSTPPDAFERIAGLVDRLARRLEDALDNGHGRRPRMSRRRRRAQR